jgi:predicted DNA-binding transcriptional regulator AlpA
MASQPASRELQLVLRRFFRLSRAQQLSAYREMRDHLADSIRETKKDGYVARKEDALRALGEVARHLGLPARVAPTPEQFDIAARELGLGWDRSKVRRAWQRWRYAKAVFLGEELPQSARERQAQRRIGRGPELEGPLEGVRLWLEAEPDGAYARSYIAWAREYNDNRPADAPPVFISAGAVAKRLKISWPDVVRLARGEITAEQARPPKKVAQPQYCKGPHQLVSAQAMSRILKKTDRGLRLVMARPDFPPPVIVLPGNHIWLRDDVEAYRHGQRWTLDEKERHHNSLRGTYMTIEEVATATGFNRAAIQMSRHGVPLPVARIGRRTLWLRSEVETSPAGKRGHSGR